MHSPSSFIVGITFALAAVFAGSFTAVPAQLGPKALTSLSAGGGIAKAGPYTAQSTMGQVAGRVSRGGVYANISGAQSLLVRPATDNPPDPNAPVVSPISDQIIEEDMRIEGIPFTIRDADTPFSLITVARESSNPELIPASGIVVAGPAGNRLVRVTPLPNRSGTALVRIVVSDGTHTVTESFQVHVTPVNDPPSISPIPDVNISSGQPGTVEFTNTDFDDAAEQLRITAISDNSALLDTSRIVHTSLGEGRSRLTVIPNPGATGVATITVTITDPAGATVQSQFRLSVTSGGEPPAPGGCFECTHVIGYSQVGALNGWFVKDGIFESLVANEKWQLQWANGATLEQWKDPSFSGWSGAIVSPCAKNSASPDRVLLNLAGPYDSDQTAWVDAVNATIDTIRSKFPGVRQIILQSIVGGPQHQVCQVNGVDVRASVSHPPMDAAIATVVAAQTGSTPQIVAGASPEVRSCLDFRDEIGHFTAAGAIAAAELLGDYYRKLDADCRPDPAGLDFGDAPELYPTLLARNGARHAIRPGFYLGAGVDTEPNGQPNTTATGDDAGGTDDGDGVQLPAALAVGTANMIKVTASAAGKLDVWLDLNRDGDWSDVNERIFNGQTLVAGVNTLTFHLPSVPPVAATFLRFRFSSAGGLSFDGPAADGEVEDYRTSLVLPAVVKQLLNGFEPVPDDDTKVAANGRVATVAPTPGSTGGGVTFKLGEARGATFALNPASMAQAGATAPPELGTEDSVELIGELSGTPQSIIGILIARMGDASKNEYALGIGQDTQSKIRNVLLVSADPTTEPVFELDANALGDLRLRPNDDLWKGAMEFHVGPESVIESIATKYTMLVSLLPASCAQAAAPSATAILGNGRVLMPAVRWLILAFDHPISSKEEADAAGFQSLRIRRRGSAAPFQISNLALLEAGWQFLGGCDDDSCGKIESQLVSTPDGAAIEFNVLGSAGPGGGPHVLEAGPVDVAEASLAVRSNAIAKSKLEEFGMSHLAAPAFDFNAIDLSRPETSLSYAILVNGPTGNETTVLRSLTSLPIPGGGFALRWSTDAIANPDPQNSLSTAETIEVMREGTVVATFSSTTQPHADGLLLEIQANGPPLTGARIGLPPTQGISFNFDRLRLEYFFAGPTTFTLPDAQIASGDSIVLITGKASFIARNPRLRLEYSSAAGGEFKVTHRRPFDWGDAPSSYTTRLAQNGARHRIVPSLRLGHRIDSEHDGLPSPDATGDDRHLTDDGDGVLLTSPLVPGGTATLGSAVQAPATGAFLDVFVDFNIDGDFADVGEKVLDKAPVKNGKNTLSFAVPSSAKVGRTFGRFRLSTAGGLGFDGPAADGEIEDHALAIVGSTTPKHPSGLTLVPQGGASLRTSTSGGTELTGLGAGTDSGVMLLASPTVLSNRSGRIVTRLQPALPLHGQPKYEDFKLLRLDARYTDASGAEVSIEVGLTHTSEGWGLFKNVSDLKSAIAVINHPEGAANSLVSVFDSAGQETGTAAVQGNHIGTLKGEANLVLAGWATFPSGCWFVLDRPITFTAASGPSFTGVVVRVLHAPSAGGVEPVDFVSLGLYSANPGQGFINLDQLTAKNPTAPNISGVHVEATGGVTLEFAKDADTFYRIERLDALGGSGWKPAGTVLGTDSSGSLRLGPHEARQQFFRVIAE